MVDWHTPCAYARGLRCAGFHYCVAVQQDAVPDPMRNGLELVPMPLCRWPNCATPVLMCGPTARFFGLLMCLPVGWERCMFSRPLLCSCATCQMDKDFPHPLVACASVGKECALARSLAHGPYLGGCLLGACNEGPVHAVRGQKGWCRECVVSGVIP